MWLSKLELFFSMKKNSGRCLIPNPSSFGLAGLTIRCFQRFPMEASLHCLLCDPFCKRNTRERGRERRPRMLLEILQSVLCHQARVPWLTLSLLFSVRVSAVPPLAIYADVNAQRNPAFDSWILKNDLGKLPWDFRQTDWNLINQISLGESQCNVVGRVMDEDPGEQGLNPYAAMETHWWSELFPTWWHRTHMHKSCIDKQMWLVMNTWKAGK